MKPDDHKELRAALCKYRQEAKSDLFVFAGPISPVTARRFTTEIFTRQKRAEQVSLVLSTWGGDAHAAYRITRVLQHLYKRFRLVAVGPCKSAGTLITIGAQEIVFGPWGELGPLDLQMNRRDEIWGLRSGLDTLRGLANLHVHAYTAFERFMLSIVDQSNGAISTKTAASLAISHCPRDCSVQ